jgi:hypothetical protein
MISILQVAVGLLLLGACVLFGITYWEMYK